jgi:hypothetical protein
LSIELLNTLDGLPILLVVDVLDVWHVLDNFDVMVDVPNHGLVSAIVPELV